MYLSRFLPIQKPFSYLSIHVNDINPLLFVVSNSLLLLPSLPLSLSLFSLYLSISLCVSVHPSPLHLSIFKLHLILSVAAAGADITQVRTLAVADFATPIAASETYLQQIQAELGDQYQAPRCAAFAVATAVGQEKIQFTNSHWQFSRAEDAVAR